MNAYRIILCGLTVLICACATSLDPADIEAMGEAHVEVHFNYPGDDRAAGIDTEADDIVVQLIDRANASVDFAVMGFSKKTIINALERAYHRGISLRFVGNSRHAFGRVRGYTVLDRLNVPTQVGNQNHIMHDKFFIVDDRFVVTGTGNITSTGFNHNDNNWVLIDSPWVAADFKAEFEQMFAGRFGYSKGVPEPGEPGYGNRYVVGDTTVEVHFSPQEDAMGRILESVENAKESIEFFIFAFTKDQLGSLFISKHHEFQRYNRCCGPAYQQLSNEEVVECEPVRLTCETPFRERYVRGVIDRSQLHSNGPYHEAYRLLSYGIDMRMDGNDNSYQPGDYQAGGGRQHSKTLVIDGQTENPVVLTGSFNWSSSATIANDETLLVIEGPRVGHQYHAYFNYLYDVAKNIGERWVNDRQGLQPGDVIINEIQWDGYNGTVDPNETSDPNSSRFYHYTFNDEFIELLNTTPRPIDLSMWTIATDDDFVVGLYPGTIIGPYERFLIVDHNTEPYDDFTPQFRGGAYTDPDFVMNSANDARFLRMNLRNARFKLYLRDPKGVALDEAGNGTAPFHGGRERRGSEDPRQQVVRSMERVHFSCEDGATDCERIGPGDQPSSWRACSQSDTTHIRPAHHRNVMATPGRPNSGTESYPEERPNWRSSR